MANSHQRDAKKRSDPGATLRALTGMSYQHFSADFAGGSSIGGTADHVSSQTARVFKLSCGGVRRWVGGVRRPVETQKFASLRCGLHEFGNFEADLPQWQNFIGNTPIYAGLWHAIDR